MNSILRIVVLVLIIVCLSLMYKLSVTTSDLEQLNIRIDAAEKAVEDQAQRFDEAYAEAQESVAAANKRANSVLVAEVPKECAGAVRWGIAQANDFK